MNVIKISTRVKTNVFKNDKGEWTLEAFYRGHLVHEGETYTSKKDALNAIQAYMEGIFAVSMYHPLYLFWRALINPIESRILNWYYNYLEKESKKC